ncbi:DUF3159 domain-containing protein [Glutamicibacter sp. JC586]|uniref:DUF3159 domain-containing protein n=1 Tax=Glutamicibacter sp. JC586 TaxID=2590552 RepID=UPI00135C4BFC|nr:DUF3159 domain-containing protein [Glutamicibacter sp. JC586]
MRNEDPRSEEPSESAQDSKPSFAEMIGANSKISQNADGGIDLLSTVGGVRGILETVVPGFLFIMVFALTSNLGWALITSISLGVLFMVVRLARRSSLIQSASGLIGILICAFAARHSGNAKDYYIPGFYTSGAYLLGLIISVVIRWPLIGLLFGFIRNEGVEWRKKADRLRRYQIATWVVIGVFAARLAVQLPMYYTDHVVALGLARALMGVPLYAAGLWFAWLLSKPAADATTSVQESTES